TAVILSRSRGDGSVSPALSNQSILSFELSGPSRWRENNLRLHLYQETRPGSSTASRCRGDHPSALIRSVFSAYRRSLNGRSASNTIWLDGSLPSCLHIISATAKFEYSSSQPTL